MILIYMFLTGFYLEKKPSKAFKSFEIHCSLVLDLGCPAALGNLLNKEESKS